VPNFFSLVSVYECHKIFFEGGGPMLERGGGVWKQAHQHKKRSFDESRGTSIKNMLVYKFRSALMKHCVLEKMSIINLTNTST